MMRWMVKGIKGKREFYAKTKFDGRWEDQLFSRMKDAKSWADLLRKEHPVMDYVVVKVEVKEARP